MNDKTAAKIFAYALLFLFLVCFSFLVLLFSTIPVNDDVFLMTNSIDWKGIAIEISAISLVIGDFICALLYLLFKFVFLKDSFSSRLNKAFIIASIYILLISVAGGISFWINKPLM